MSDRTHPDSGPVTPGEACFSAADMATAAAQGFRDGVASVVAENTNTEREATGPAEVWLRSRYGAYRCHFAWRELEEAFNAGRASLSLPAAGQESVAVTEDMRSAVRWAPSSAYWSERLRHYFGEEAREGIDALERQLRDALTAPHRQVPAIQRYKIGYHSDEWGVRSLSPSGIYDDAGPWVRYEDHAAVITALRAYCQELEAQVILDCMTHDQKPAEIEHVAGDVSKNGAEVNMSTQQQECGNTPYDEGPFALAQPVAQRGAADGFFLLLPQRPKPEAPAGTAGLDWDAYSGAQMLAFGRDCSDAAIAALRTQQPAPAPQQEAQEPVGWRYIPSPVWGEYVLTGDAKKAEVARKHGLQVEALCPAAPPTAQAEGWRLVPVEPTTDQEWAGKQAALRGSTMAEACKIYKAMLAAAPLPPTPVGGAAILKEILAAACCEDSETNLTSDQYRKLYDLQRRIESMPTPPAQAADSVLEDAARLDWLDQQCEAYGFQDIHEGNRWEISGPYANVRVAIDAERAARKQGANHD